MDFIKTVNSSLVRLDQSLLWVIMSSCLLLLLDEFWVDLIYYANKLLFATYDLFIIHLVVALKINLLLKLSNYRSKSKEWMLNLNMLWLASWAASVKTVHPFLKERKKERPKLKCMWHPSDNAQDDRSILQLYAGLQHHTIINKNQTRAKLKNTHTNWSRRPFRRQVWS